jgi:hypothetical protein
VNLVINLGFPHQGEAELLDLFAAELNQDGEVLRPGIPLRQAKPG